MAREDERVHLQPVGFAERAEHLEIAVVRADEQRAVPASSKRFELRLIVELDRALRKPSSPHRSLVEDGLAELQDVIEGGEPLGARAPNLSQTRANPLEVVAGRAPRLGGRQTEIGDDRM